MMINYLLILNFIGLIICLIDKIKAIKHKYRIPEKILLLVNILGGCFGFILGMILFHHKTKKIKFLLFVPILCFMWTIILLFFFNML